MKKIILAIAALFIAFLAACSNDYGSGTAVNAGEGPIVMPETHKAADFNEPEIESSASKDDSDKDAEKSSASKDNSDKDEEKSSSSSEDAESSSSKK